ncbi:MAG: biotin synthase BioB [Phycisphaeraceae bacterium]
MTAATHATADAPSASRLAELAQQILAGHRLTRDEAREVAAVDPFSDDVYDLFYWANKLRIHHVGRHVRFCSIVTGKLGACSEDCGFCAQSKHYKTHVTPAKMSVDEMQQAAEQARANGANSFGIVNAGRGPSDRELDWMEPFFRKTASEHRIRPCATLGELRPDQARRLRDMGVERINHNLETSRRFFPSVVSTHTYDDRVATLRAAKDAGLQLCSGGIFGLGETWEDRLDMAFTLRDELEADVIPINFLNAIPGTPLYGQSTPLEPLEALKIIAVYRFVLPDRELKVAGGREKILRDMQSWMFFAGGNSFLIGNYLTSFGRSPRDDHQMLRDLGMGFSTYDEVEHDADPASATETGPGHAGRPDAGQLMSRREGSLVALPVVN